MRSFASKFSIMSSVPECIGRNCFTRKNTVQDMSSLSEKATELMKLCVLWKGRNSRSKIPHIIAHITANVLQYNTIQYNTILFHWKSVRTQLTNNKARHVVVTVDFLIADFGAISEFSRKNLRWVLKINVLFVFVRTRWRRRVWF